MRRRAKSILKLLFVVTCLFIGYYCVVLHQNETVVTRNRVDVFERDLNDVHHNVQQDSGSKLQANRPTGKFSLPYDWEHRTPGDFEFPKFVGSKLGNYEAEITDKRAGAGEYGEAVELDASLNNQVRDVIGEFGFNLVASDRISLDRAPKDLRHQECKHWDYPEKLVPVSVILVFHNEGWSPLMRTVHNVINFTPTEYLHEIIMIDDGSNKPHLKEKLDEYLKQPKMSIVKLHRNARREGLIRARSIGAKHASGQILIYFDAHCETEPNWLAPLITPIINDHRACTVPLIDAIDGNKYTFTEQAGGDENGHARGAWDWSFSWKRIPLTKKEKQRRKHLTEPYRSPAMAGGLFAIDREFFFEIGLYDDGLDIWGGENFELSYKVWMCGGQLLFVPCSRVGHVYRLPGWRGNPPPSYVPHDSVWRNYRRVIETWWDSYKKYFYMRKPEVERVHLGDLTQVRKVREQLQCRTFEWFMEEIAYDIPLHFPLVEPPPGASGHITNIGTNLCLDGKFGGSGAPVQLSPCQKNGAEMNWWLSWHEDIRPGGHTQDTARKVCLDCVGKNNVVSFWECHEQGGNQLFKFIFDQNQIYHSITGSCLEASPDQDRVYTRTCDRDNKNQFWVWTNTNITRLSEFNRDMNKAVYHIEV